MSAEGRAEMIAYWMRPEFIGLFLIVILAIAAGAFVNK